MAFIRISGTGLDAILEPLKSPSHSGNWLFAAEATAVLGTNGAPAIPSLIPALQNTNASVREKALDALSAIHMSPEFSVPAILPLVAAANTNAGQRATALTILRNFGPSARAMVIDPEAARKAGIDSGSVSN